MQIYLQVFSCSRIVVQPGGAISEKITLDMKSSDLVADLRAEIAVWWEDKVGTGMYKVP